MRQQVKREQVVAYCPDRLSQPDDHDFMKETLIPVTKINHSVRINSYTYLSFKKFCPFRFLFSSLSPMNLLSLFGCYQRESTNCDLIPCVNLTLEGEYVFFTLFLTNPLSKCCLLLQHEDSVNLLLDNGLTDTKHVVISLSSAQP